MVLSYMVQSHMGEFNLGRSAPDGRQLAAQAANLTFQSACIGCYRPNIHPSPYTQPLLILIYCPSESGRLSRPRHSSRPKCAARAQSCVSQ